MTRWLAVFLLAGCGAAFAGEGHDAGYEWAEDNDITDPDDCDGNSQSFIEGCEEWAEENEDDESKIEDGDCDDEDDDGECDW